jgi:DNA-binding response OmpR family regulator
VEKIVLGNLELDTGRFHVRVDGRAVDLTYTQFELLHCLARNADRVVDRQELLRAIWRTDADADAGRLRVQVSRLRKKIAASRPWKILTVTKRGYALARDDPRARVAPFSLAPSPVSSAPEAS